MSGTVLITMKTNEEIRRTIEAGLGGPAGIVYLEDLDQGQRAGAFKEAEVVLFFHFSEEIAPEERPWLEGSALLQSIPAGVEMLPFADLPPEPTICANAGAWAEPLAEYFLGMMIALGKEFLLYRQKLAREEFDRSEVRCFQGAVLGIVGFGGIGRAVARVVRPLKMRIMALTSRGRTDEQVDFIGTLDDLEQVLRASDVVLLSIPLTRRTRGLIGARELGWMKEDAVLINVARGPIVDEEALYRHLQTHPDFKFGSDVWWREPMAGEEFSLRHPLFDSPNVLGTPHNADLVKGMVPIAVGAAVANVARYLEGQPLQGVVNRSDYA